MQFLIKGTMLPSRCHRMSTHGRRYVAVTTWLQAICEAKSVNSLFVWINTREGGMACAATKGFSPFSDFLPRFISSTLLFSFGFSLYYLTVTIPCRQCVKYKLHRYLRRLISSYLSEPGTQQQGEQRAPARHPRRSRARATPTGLWLQEGRASTSLSPRPSRLLPLLPLGRGRWRGWGDHWTRETGVNGGTLPLTLFV